MIPFVTTGFQLCLLADCSAEEHYKWLIICSVFWLSYIVPGKDVIYDSLLPSVNVCLLGLRDCIFFRFISKKGRVGTKKSTPIYLVVAVNRVSEMMPVSVLDVMLIHQHSFLVYNEEAVKYQPNGNFGVSGQRGI